MHSSHWPRASMMNALFPSPPPLSPPGCCKSNMPIQERMVTQLSRMNWSVGNFLACLGVGVGRGWDSEYVMPHKECQYKSYSTVSITCKSRMGVGLAWIENKLNRVVCERTCGLVATHSGQAENKRKAEKEDLNIHVL